MINQVFSIRGATTIEEDTAQEIADKTAELYAEIFRQNNLASREFDIVNIMLSSTSDVTAFYPARALREKLNVSAPLFSALEPQIEGALQHCIRIMITVSNAGEKVEAKHVYLHKASALRKDLIH